MSFILTLFHVMIFIICLCRTDMAAAIHDGCWAVKFLLVCAGYVGSFWIDSSFFTDFYMKMAMGVSVIFLLY